MNIYSVSWGYGKSHALAWFAATNEAKATEQWLIMFPHRSKDEIRTVQCLRAVDGADAIDTPGPIVFAGFGVTGPARSAPGS